jgi:carbonic anhydrase
MRREWLWGTGALVAVASIAFMVSEQAQFVAGGALVNVGFRMQDHLDDFDPHHDGHLTPDEVWQEVLEQNEMAAQVRKWFPRTARHPEVAIVVCMDARIDTNELVGDTRKYYYVVRTAGSVLSEKEEEMLELAVENGVKAVVLTTHTDCAAEKVASDEKKRLEYPHLTQAVEQREARWAELLGRPKIKARLDSGALVVKRVRVDSATDEMQVEDLHAMRQAHE